MADIVEEPVEIIEPDPRNPRLHTPEHVSQLRRSIEMFGFTNPILIDSNRVVAGHGRRLAALEIYAEGGSHLLPAGRRRWRSSSPGGFSPLH